jgi:Fe-Mn family superoxide dismutase
MYDRIQTGGTDMFTLPDLPYAYNALEPYIDEKTMLIHHDKHHGAYVKNLNDALSGQTDWLTMNVWDILTKLEAVPHELRMKVRNNGGGHANHEMFWRIMTPALSAGKPQGNIATAINAAFGSFEKFQEKFSAAALGRFGSGWVWLVKDGSSLAIVDTANQDNPISIGKKPFLGLDVWEHAYYLKYQNMRADYIKAWWNVVNWQEVERWFSTSK